MKWLIIGLIAAQAFDVTTTLVALDRGCKETVWPTQNPWVIAGAKVGAVTGLILLAPRIKWKGLTVLVVAGTVSGIYGGVHNMRVIPKCPSMPYQSEQPQGIVVPQG